MMFFIKLTIDGILTFMSMINQRELVALLNLSSWCLVMVERLFLVVPWGCLRFVIVVFPGHTQLLLCSFELSMKKVLYSRDLD